MTKRTATCPTRSSRSILQSSRRSSDESRIRSAELRARPRRGHRFGVPGSDVHGPGRLDGNDAPAGRCAGAASAAHPQRVTRNALRERRPGGQASRRRHHGVVRVDRASGRLRDLDPARVRRLQFGACRRAAATANRRQRGRAGRGTQRLFGSTVQLASRICAHARSDQILVADVVVENDRRDEVAFRKVEAATLKGFENTVPLFEVPWR